MIIPAGVNKLQWSPKKDKAEEKEMVRTASVEGEAQKKVVDAEVEEPDALAEAARAFLATKQAESDDSEKSCCKKEGCEADASCDCKEGCEYCSECCYTKAGTKEPIVEAAGDVKAGLGCITEEAPCCEEGGLPEVVVEDEAVIPEADGAAVIEVSEGFPEESTAEVSEIEIAIDDVEEALEVVKEVVESITGEGEAEVTEVSLGEEADIPGVMDSEEGEVETEKEGMQVMMSSDEDFCKFAKLSPQNRSKLSNYWVNMLGYPKDYVSLLTKDYEK